VPTTKQVHPPLSRAASRALTAVLSQRVPSESASALRSLERTVSTYVAVDRAAAADFNALARWADLDCHQGIYVAAMQLSLSVYPMSCVASW
jgi:hypothetical protein